MDKRTLIPALLAATALAGCASPAPRAASPAPPPVSLTKVYFYPEQGQTEAQQDRDRYDCYVWSVRQTGFDPARRIAPRETRATVVPARSPGQTIGAAAMVGAVIGALAADDDSAAKGAVVGAMAGTVVGSAAAASQAQTVNRVESRRDARIPGRYEQQAAEYRRAMSACLEGRGYSVR